MTFRAVFNTLKAAKKLELATTFPVPHSPIPFYHTRFALWAMPSPARVALHQEITRLIARARCAVMQSSVIMQYDPLSQDLRPWHW